MRTRLEITTSCSGASTYSFMLLAPFRVNLLRRLDLDVRLPLALGKLRVAKLGGMVQNSGSFLIAAVIELVIVLVKGDPVISGITLHSLPVLLYTGIVVTGIGYFAYLKAIELSGPSNASVAFFIKPVIAVILAQIILGEPVRWNIVFGVCLILIGSLINMLGARHNK